MTQAPFQSCSVYRYQQPLSKPLPLKTVTLTERQGLILEMIDQNGLFHYGEAAPLPDFSRETVAEAQQQLKEAAEHYCAGKLPDHSLLYPSVAFAIESIQFSLSQGRWRQQKAPESPLLMGADALTLKRLEDWSGKWPDEFKLKVGRHRTGQDAAVVKQVLDRIPVTVKLRLDANQRWSFDEAVDFARQVPVSRISYIEEPTPCCEEFPRLFRETGVGYGLDETLQRPAFDRSLLKINGFRAENGLRAVVLKPTLVGGVSKCLSLADWARKKTIRVVFSSSFESALGVSLIEQLSLHCDPLESPGLDTLSAFQNPGFCRLPEYGQPLSLDLLSAMEKVWRYRSAR
ncbi:o-succinylbenzoate synthase [Endozoicomonas sp. 4G]|uniref:o-succinylbenzoate synthase n=1 Tax=Endozoicomonas sp. 4G TaxID=2872754 RepID=UPI0020790855|nr:o-succinylbenzoate synthase [Endozoicomonas sp. 4G]